MFIAGPNDEDMGLHDWFFSPSGGEVVDESVRETGVIVLGRQTYDRGDRVDGFADSPYRVDHFMVTHDVPEKAVRGGTKFTFITEGVGAAVERAKVAAGYRNVAVGH